jgi:hypothetical protein
MCRDPAVVLDEAPPQAAAIACAYTQTKLAAGSRCRRFATSPSVSPAGQCGMARRNTNAVIALAGWVAVGDGPAVGLSDDVVMPCSPPKHRTRSVFNIVDRPQSSSVISMCQSKRHELRVTRVSVLVFAALARRRLLGADG